MIHDLDKTLEELLKRGLPPSLIGPDALTPVAISFAPPDDDFSKSVSRQAIDLFLYDVRENLGYATTNGSSIAVPPRSPSNARRRASTAPT